MLCSENLIASVHPSDEASLKAFRENLCAEAVTENRSVVEKSKIIFISVKPNVVKTVLDEVKAYASGKLFVSIAMGTKLNEIEQILPNDSRVIRVMPNTPAIVQAACSVFVKGKSATCDDVNLVQKLLKSVGTCEEVSESMMDTVTALSGSGPAYVCIKFYNFIKLSKNVHFISFCGNYLGVYVDRGASRWWREMWTRKKFGISFGSTDGAWFWKISN